MVDEQVVEKFISLEITNGKLELKKMGLHGPSSIWTYIINDQAIMNSLASTLVSSRQIGFAAHAGLLAPAILASHFVRQMKRRATRK